MRRRSSGADESLELLLDTICNTFGGIVFMALLVCLMTQNTGSKVPSAADADKQLAEVHEARRAQGALRDLLAQRQSLERTRAEQARLLQAMKAGSSSAETDAILKLTLEQQQVRLELAEQERKLQTAKLAAQELQKTLSRMDGVVIDAKHAADAAARKYQAQKERQTVRLRLPMARATSKRQAGFLLCERKLRQIYSYDEGGTTVGYHPIDLRPQVDRDEISPTDFAPDGGVLIDGTEASFAAVSRRFGSLSKTRHYIAIALWPDSYKEFRVLRDHLLKLGFEYELILVGDENAISLGSGGGGRVQ